MRTPFTALTSARPVGRQRSSGLAAIAVILLAACNGDSPLGPGGNPRAIRPLAAIAPASRAEFYVHAHQDDWQLFMGDRTSQSVATGGKVVFIYATAGDAGSNDVRYWTTRETGSRASVDAITGSGTWTCANETINGHPIRRCAKGTGLVVSYFMRMPDGNTTGDGFGFGSLKRLRDQNTPTSAIDQSTTYASWSDFSTTLRGIIELEGVGLSGSNLVVHSPDDDRNINSGDHPDHFATADAVRAAAQSRDWSFAWYVNYHTRDLAPNLSQAALDTKRTEFLAYDNVMANAGFGSLAQATDYQTWLARTYFRTEQSSPSVTPPAAPTALAAQAVSVAQIALTWTDNAADETGFKVERAPDNAGAAGAYSEVATVGPNVTSYADAGRNAGTRYWYRVRAFNTGGNSGYSNEASATTPPRPVSTRVEFYVHAHSDDWPLFMGDRAAASIQSGAKVIFVYTTAGDAGSGDVRFWTTRETASQAAVNAVAGSGTWTCAAQTVDGHAIRRCTTTSANVVAYYMRLPDGNNTTGDGFGLGSIKRLRDLNTPTSAIDQSTTYASWTDFHTTLRDLIDLEAGEAGPSDLIVHSPDDDRIANVGDHPDHFATGDAVRDASRSRAWSLAWYVGYHTRDFAPNLSQAALDTKRAEFVAHDNVMAAAGFGSLIGASEYQVWLERTYVRAGQSTPGTLPPPPSGLTARAQGNSGNLRLTWTPGGATNVDVWRNGTRIATRVENSGTYTDRPPRGVTYSYKVCTGGQTVAAACSNTAVIGF